MPTFTIDLQAQPRLPRVCVVTGETCDLHSVRFNCQSKRLSAASLLTVLAGRVLFWVREVELDVPVARRVRNRLLAGRVLGVGAVLLGICAGAAALAWGQLAWLALGTALALGGVVAPEVMRRRVLCVRSLDATSLVVTVPCQLAVDAYQASLRSAGAPRASLAPTSPERRTLDREPGAIRHALGLLFLGAAGVLGVGLVLLLAAVAVSDKGLTTGACGPLVMIGALDYFLWDRACLRLGWRRPLELLTRVEQVQST